MNGVNQRGILSFFQNVSSQKAKSKKNTVPATKKCDKNESMDNKKQDLEKNDNGDIIVITDEQVENDKNHSYSADLIQQNRQSSQDKNAKGLKENAEVLLDITVEDMDSEKTQFKMEDGAFDSSDKTSVEVSSLDNQTGENLSENEKENGPI